MTHHDGDPKRNRCTCRHNCKARWRDGYVLGTVVTKFDRINTHFFSDYVKYHLKPGKRKPTTPKYLDIRERMYE